MNNEREIIYMAATGSCESEARVESSQRGSRQICHGVLDVNALASDHMLKLWMIILLYLTC